MIVVGLGESGASASEREDTASAASGTAIDDSVIAVGSAGGRRALIR